MEEKRRSRQQVAHLGDDGMHLDMLGMQVRRKGYRKIDAMWE